MSAQQKMKWAELVDRFMNLAERFARREIQPTQYSEEYRELMKLMADEIRSNPYGGPDVRK